MDRFVRTVLGYHGCHPDFAEALLRGEVAVDSLDPSQNAWDWLGHGIYFWEYAPERAMGWSGAGGVIGAIVQLGQCLDFTDLGATRLLAGHHNLVFEEFRLTGRTLPENKGSRGDPDWLVVNQLVTSIEGTGLSVQTLR